MTARILVANASAVATTTLGAWLRAEYLTVAVARGEAAAQKMARDWRPDLILLQPPPGPDALAICRRFRLDPCTRHLPLVLLAPGGDPALLLPGLDAGADDVLTAPHDAELVLARVQALVRASQLQDELRMRGETAQALGLSADTCAQVSVAGGRALVIDDDDAATQQAQDWLARDGIVSGRAGTGAQAGELSAAVSFDLLVLSLSLLTDDPLRIVAELRAAEPTRRVPLLLLAGAGGHAGGRARLLRGFALGAEDCLAGPFCPEELRARARRLLRRKFHQDRLRADLGQAFEVALIDPLTDCYNARYLARHLRGLLASGPPQGLAVLLLDVDRFKDVNDRFGHAAGDAALAALAQMLRGRIRALDSIARFSGEEFVVVMPGCALDEALDAAERLRGSVETLVIQAEPGEACALTVSIGVVATGRLAVTPEQLLHLAQRGAQAAHARGGNRVATAPPPAESASTDLLAADCEPRRSDPESLTLSWLP